MLVLRDVLGFHADEVAEMLGTSPASVNSALQRARATLEQRLPPRRERLSALPPTAGGARLVGRFADAFERDDIDGVVALLTEDAVVSMPPEPEWHQGRAAVEAFLRARHVARAAAPVAVRRRPAPTASRRSPTTSPTTTGWVRSGMFVVGVRPDGIESITRFARRRTADRASGCRSAARAARALSCDFLRSRLLRHADGVGAELALEVGPPVAAQLGQRLVAALHIGHVGAEGSQDEHGGGNQRR